MRLFGTTLVIYQSLRCDSYRAEFFIKSFGKDLVNSIYFITPYNDFFVNFFNIIDLNCMAPVKKGFNNNLKKIDSARKF